MAIIIVDCEAPFGVGAPSVGDMTEFGAARFIPDPPYHDATFHGVLDHADQGEGSWCQTFLDFDAWLMSVRGKGGLVFVSDNPAYDFQWISFYAWRYLGRNPFGHSGRRIGDFYAGLTGDFRNTQRWKRLRITKHDHNPVHDAIGNAEALGRMLRGERA